MARFIVYDVKFSRKGILFFRIIVNFVIRKCDFERRRREMITMDVGKIVDNYCG